MTTTSTTRLFTALTAVLIAANTWAGAILTTANQVAVGPVADSDTQVALKTEFGIVKYKKAKVRWYTKDKAVDSMYMAGLEAYRLKEPQVAMHFLRNSVKTEPANSKDATRAIQKITREMSPEAEVAESAHKKAPPKPVTNAIVRMLDKQIVRVDDATEELVEFDREQLGGKDYYAVYFSAHWCPPCRGFTPKLVKFYDTMQDTHGEKFDIIFVSADRNQEEFAGYMKEANMKWPAVAYSDARKSALRQYAGRGIPCLVLLDSGGNVIADSYVDKKYVGPTVVMNKLNEILTGEE